MGLANVEQRFKALLAEPGTIAHEVHAALAEAATKINAMVDEQPVLFSIIQHLEMAAHLTVSSPTLTTTGSAEANPTQAASTPAAPTTEVPTSTGSSSTPNSTDSADTSSKGSAK